MRLRKRSICYALIQNTILIIQAIILFNTKDYTCQTFLYTCKIGTIFMIFETILLMLQQKRMVSIINIIFILFYLFQFGIPICFAFDSSYSTHHLVNFSNEVLVKASIYTIISVSIMACALSIILSVSHSETEKRSYFFKSKALSDEKSVVKISQIIFLLTGVIVIPLYCYAVYLSLTNGFSQETRGILSNRNIYNIARSFFFCSGIMYITYNYENRNNCYKYVEIIIILSVILTMVIGARGEGLTWFVAYLYGKTIIIKNEKLNNNNFFLVGICLFFLAIISVFIAEIRINSSVGVMEIFNGRIILKFISELGFNFTTICYVMMYVPNVLNFQYGYTYLLTILSLIPNSVDLMGISKHFRTQLPLFKLAELLHHDFNGTLDWGVGYSFNAESFYNFSWGGVFMSIPFAIFLALIEREDKIERNKWNKYVKIVVFRNLLMFPRQMSFELVNSILYQIVFMAFIIIVVENFVALRRR